MWFDEKRGQALLDKIGLPERVSLTIKATNFCPNFCDFCCMDSNLQGSHLDLEKTKSFILDIEKNNSKISEIQLTGGEALFNDNIIDFLYWAKSKKYKTLLLTSGVNPKKEFSKIYNKRLKECIKNYFIDEIGITYSAGIQPEKRIENLDKLLNRTKAFSKCTVHVGQIIDPNDGRPLGELVLTRPFRQKKKYHCLGTKLVAYSGRGKKEIKISKEHENCEFIDIIDDIKTKEYLITILEHGEVYPCCMFEPVIKGMKPIGTIEEGYLEIIKKSYCYQELLKKFFVQSKIHNCSVCANEFDNFLKR